LAPPPAAESGYDWPGFRGPDRDGVIPGVRIETDWSASPPVELWRRPVGPGVSSFAVHGDLFYTQEQRGNDEVVACYNLTTGKLVWRHSDAARFWESNAGAGPRATPTLSHGRVYALGATGILNALDASTGAVVWSRNAASDTGAKVPTWGISGSPLVVDDLVLVAASGTLAAYDVATGDSRWIGPHRGGSYSSPQLATIDGVAQILLLSPPGAISLAPADGAVLWEHSWDGGAIVQPALTANGDLLINAIASSGGIGIRRLALAHGAAGWTTEERWTSNGLKPFFSDFVVHEGHAFGFDGNILSCIDLADGKRKWKGGRYGNGQLVLLADQDLLLVLSEEGELALVKAAPDAFTEVARFPGALEGKTWNHPVLVGDILLVRNGEAMAAFRLAPAGSLRPTD
jgi:outer membrane protein assembly factor BamB